MLDRRRPSERDVHQDHTLRGPVRAPLGAETDPLNDGFPRFQALANPRLHCLARLANEDRPFAYDGQGRSMLSDGRTS